MPNWAYNELKVTGPAADLEDFRTSVIGYGPWGPKREAPEEVFCFHKIYPMPEGIVEAHRRDPTNDDWYDWASRHWGTKWSADSTTVKEVEGGLEYSFDTAWSPPTGVLMRASIRWPSLTFHLFFTEEGNDNGGIYTYTDGVVDQRDMTAVRAYLEEKGVYSSTCHQCDEMFEVFELEDLRLKHAQCFNCLRNYCRHCQEHRDQHTGNKCLFDAITFESVFDPGEQL